MSASASGNPVTVQIRQIFISPGHNFIGHHGRPPGDFPLVEVSEIECVASRGLRGDRYFDFRENYKGQITFFSAEVFEKLCANFGINDKSAGVLRRNLIVSGIDLNELIGEEFSVQGVRFRGTEHCRPCYWLDQAVAPGTEQFLQTNGGLRAQILTNGILKIDRLQHDDLGAVIRGNPESEKPEISAC
jgi:MOSC domain-containing protein YiiM